MVDRQPRSQSRGPEVATPLDLAWLAGLLEGEGSFKRGAPSSPRLPVISVTMTDEDVVARVAALWGVRHLTVRPRRDHWAVSYATQLRGADAVAWMRALRPFLGARRKAQADRAMASYVTPAHRVLDDAGAATALAWLSDGRSVREVAERLGTSIWTIYDLRLGRTYRHLEPSPEERRARLLGRAA